MGWVHGLDAAGYDTAEYDQVVASGEQVTVGLLAIALQTIGVPAQSFLGWQAGFATDVAYGKARILEVDPEPVRACLAAGKVAVVAGFQGMSPERRVTTLGRGGSDTSAVALAAALGADRCDIFTDVDGVYTTDPRIVAKARKLDRITYEEMLEMASLGAKVLQTRSVALAMQHRVRVQVLSSFEDLPGTLVVDEDEIVESQIVSGIAYSRDEARVTVLGVHDRPGVAAAIFGPLSEHGINVDMIVQSVSRDGVYANLTFTVSRADLPRALAVLERAKGDIGYESRRRRRRRVQGLGRRRRHALACRHRAPDVHHACRQGHQHPGHLDVRDQGQRADRRGIHRAGAAGAALGLRPGQGLTGVGSHHDGSTRSGSVAGASSAASSPSWAVP